MTTTESHSTTETRNGHSLTGTLILLRFMLRRDRIRLPSWVLGLTLYMTYCLVALDNVVDNQQDLEGLASVNQTPIGALLGGPALGFENITLERFLMGEYALYALIGACVLGLLTIVRHTRVEERTGRAELVRANVVGRHAQLTAAFIIAFMTSLIAAAFISALLLSYDFDAGSTTLFAAGIIACTMAFAGVAAVAVQLSEYPRAASGFAAAALGTAFILRGLGDMASVQDNNMSWLSWLSPIAWSQQTGPFVYDRWWPLAITLAFAIITATIGYAMSARRDLDAGLFPPRLGSPSAAAWLSNPPALAFRLQRANLVGWSMALLVTGLAFGAFAEAIVDGFDDLSDDLLAIMGGSDELLLGYVGMMGILMAYLISVYGVLFIQSLRGEETDGRTEPVLATAISRPTWMGSNLLVSGLGILLLTLLAGLGLGLAAAGSTSDSALLGDMMGSVLAHLPAVFLVLALAAVLYGWLPSTLPLAWAVVGYSFIVGFFGPALNIPDGLINLSPFEHVGRYPQDDINPTAIAVLTGIAIVLVLVALAGFRRRDLITK